MARQSKSQWDFTGELFPTETLRRVFSVTELTVEVRRLLEKQIGEVWVSGEVTNLRIQSSGHIYFSIKDAGAQLGCVLFRGDPVANRDVLQDGRKVVLKGEMTVYEARGQYQLHVQSIELQGIGALQAAFEKLKQKLNAEGLFEQERKRPLPQFVCSIGLVTSPTGAAIRDVLHVIERRNRSLKIFLAPCAVQGAGAASEIASSIRLLNAWSEKSKNKLDLILVTRGGGSLEDLWAFNEEVVARAIFGSTIPVVSAVGHEIDFTISDFVADLRAATPSAAAEIITEGTFSAGKWAVQVPSRIRDRLMQRFSREETRIDQLLQRLSRAHPRRSLNEGFQHVDDLVVRLNRCARHDLSRCQTYFIAVHERFGRIHPMQAIEKYRPLVEQERRRLDEVLRHRLQEHRQRFETLQTRLRLLAPDKVLSRGYSITTDAETGKVIRSANQVQAGQKLRTRLHTGEVSSVVDQ